MIFREITLSELAKELDAKLIGNPDFIVSKVSEPDNYEEKSIVLIKNPKKWLQTNAEETSLPGCIVVEKNVMSNYNGNQLIVSDYDIAMIKLLSLFEDKKERKQGIGEYVVQKSKNISKSAYIENFVTIEANSKIGDETYIGHGVFVGKNVIIGNNVYIYPNCIIYDGTIIEDNVIIHSGCVIGAEGFGYIEVEGKRVKVPQIGNVIIKEGVEMGANCCVDRSTIGSTIIGANTKIDNLCHIAHNVKIGENCIIIAQTGISGSCTLGNNCILGGQVGLTDHVTLEAGTIVGAQSGVAVSSGRHSKYLLGTPARDMSKEKKIWAFLNKAPEILDRLRKLERQIK